MINIIITIIIIIIIKIVVEKGVKHPSGSTAILYMPREKGGRGV